MKIGRLLAFAALGFILGGCARDGAEDGAGNLGIAFSSDASVEGVQATRALAEWDELTALLPAESEFSLTVKDSEDATVKTWDSVEEFPEEGASFSPGNYTAIAFCADDEVTEGFDCPRFGVTKPFTIVNGETTTIEMTARLLNMAVTVDYTEDFENYFPTCSVALVRDEEEIVDFADMPESALAAFIEPEPFKVVISATRGNGTTYSTEFDVEGAGIKACTRQKITIGIDGEIGDISFNITFNDTPLDTVTVAPIETGDEE
jgi:hypothetical protein